ncbi:MAG TPA: bifunctional UDP-sugar hydrolase/5'-nucleotidase [Caulobacterales bacterium]|nr:bifunctional UDP-sugar hydrolase/5'-nucleotidase [Caulobacterales bacterium]
MKLRWKIPLHTCLLVAILTACAPFAERSTAQRSSAAKPETVSITLLSTTDLHGRLEAWDYSANKPANLGLVKIATLVKQARTESPDALLVDIGDMVQDPQSMLTNFYLTKHPKDMNPNIALMNHLRYDAMAAGNHEFLFTPEPLWTLKGASTFPWLCANVKQTYTQGVPYFQPYIIKTVKGVRVGIVAFVAPVAPKTKEYDFEPILESAKRVIPELRPQVDLLVVLLHSGFARDPLGDGATRVQVPGENVAPEFAEQIPGVDVIIYGHTHTEMPEKLINGVLMTEAKFWAQSLARVDVTMTKNADGRWAVASKHARTIPVTADVQTDPETAAVIQPYRQELDRYLDTPIATAAMDLSGTHARYEDTPLLDVVQQAQMEAAHADVSMSNLLDERVKLARGPITVRQAGTLYPLSDSANVVAMTGAGLKEALEHSASFYPQWPPKRGVALTLPTVKPDQAAGVSYAIDLTKPVGSRVRNLRFNGKPLDLAQKLRVAVSTNRRFGDSGYTMYKDLPVVSQSGDMRAVVIEYLGRAKSIPAEADRNWRITPRAAVVAMEKLADAQAVAQK